MDGCRCQTIQTGIIVHKSCSVPNIIPGFSVLGKNFRAFSVLIDGCGCGEFGVWGEFQGGRDLPSAQPAAFSGFPGGCIDCP